MSVAVKQSQWERLPSLAVEEMQLRILFSLSEVKLLRSRTPNIAIMETESATNVRLPIPILGVIRLGVYGHDIEERKYATTNNYVDENSDDIKNRNSLVRISKLCLKTHK